MPVQSLAHRAQPYVLLTFTALVLTSILLGRTDPRTQDHPEFTKDQDHRRYEAMARLGPSQVHEAPFCWRVGVPLVAAALPWSLQQNFLMLSVIAIAATPLALYAAIRAFGIDVGPAVLTALSFFTLGWATKYLIFDFWMTDAITHLFLAAGLWAILRGNMVTLAAILWLGVGVKETVLALLPLYYGLRARRLLDPRTATTTILLAAPALLVLAAVRTLVVADNLHEYAYATRIGSAWTFRAEQPLVETLYKWTIGAYSMPVVALAVLGIRAAPTIGLRLAPFLLCVHAQLLLAYNTERLLVAGFPALLILAAIGLNRLLDELSWRTPSAAVAISPFVACLWVGRRLPELPPPIAMGVGVAAALAFLVLRAWQNATRPMLPGRLEPVIRSWLFHPKRVVAFKNPGTMFARP